MARAINLISRLKRKSPYDLAQELLSPFKTEEGLYDVGKAYESDIDKDILKTMFGEEAITGFETAEAQIAELEPYRIDETHFDVLKALESGVSQDTLKSLFGEDVVNRLTQPVEAETPAFLQIQEPPPVITEVQEFTPDDAQRLAQLEADYVTKMSEEAYQIYNNLPSDAERLQYLERRDWEQTVLPTLPQELRALYANVPDEEFNELLHVWQVQQQEKITEMMSELFPSLIGEQSENMRTAAAMTFLQYLQTDENTQKLFYETLNTIGRNETTENLLDTIIPGITERDKKIIFGENVLPLKALVPGTYDITEQPFEDLVQFGNEDPVNFRIAFRYEGRTPETEQLLKELYGEDVVTEDFLKKFFEQTTADAFIQGEWVPEPLEDYWDMAMQGIGDIYTMLGGVAERFGADSIGESLQRVGSYGQYYAREVEKAPSYSPQWFAQNIARMTPMMLGLMGISLITGGAASSAVAAAGGGAFLQSAVGAVASGITASAGEGLLEAGDAYNEAISRGFTQEEANAVFDKVMLGNVAGLSVSNIAQYALTFFVPGGKTAGFMVKALTYGFDVASEGIEEAGQLMIQRAALGDAQAFDEEMLQNTIMGMVAGAGFASIGAANEAIKSRIEEKMEPDQYNKIRKRITELIGQGMLRKEAEAKAWDEFAETPEGDAIIKETAEEVFTQNIDEIKIDHKAEIDKAIIEISKSLEITPEEFQQAPVADVLAGEADVGIQQSMLPEVAAQEVRTPGKGKITQGKLEDFVKYQQAMQSDKVNEFVKEKTAKEVETPPVTPEVKEGKSTRIEQIKAILAQPGRSPKGEKTKAELKKELARLQAEELVSKFTKEQLDYEIELVDAQLQKRFAPYKGNIGRYEANRYPEYNAAQLEEYYNTLIEARGQKPKAEVEAPAPPSPPAPPVKETRQMPEPPQRPRKMEDIIKSISDAIREAKPARKETEQLKHKELQKRAAIYASILQSGEGYRAFVKAKSALKGALPSADFILDLEAFGITDADIQAMFDKIRTSGLRPFEKLNTADALDTLLTGMIPTKGQIDLLENMFGVDFAKAITSKYPTSKKIGRLAQEVLNIPRTLQTIADLSATFRQGILLAFGQPVQFAKAFIKELQVVFSEKNYQNLIDTLDNTRYSDKAAEHKLYLAYKSGVTSEITTREEAFMGRILERVPVLGSIVRASERAFNGFLDTLRAETWNYYCRKWEGTGKTWEDYNKLADFINHATGRGDLGKFESAGAWLNAAFFSPRWVISRVQVPLDILTTTPSVRKVAARNLVSFFAAGMTAIGLAAMGGAETEDDPRSADFGKIKIGNTRIDFWGSYLPYIRFVAQVLTGERKSTASGSIYEVDRQELVDNFKRSKIAPVPGMIWDVMQGETFTGEELTEENALELIIERLTPIFIQDIKDAFNDAGLSAAAGYGALAVLGVGIQTYEDNWNTLKNNLGLPKYDVIIPYTAIKDPYTTKDYYSDVGRMIGDATSEMLKNKNTPALVISVAEARDINKKISIIPNIKIKSINADEKKGDTYETYYNQWQERAQLVKDGKDALLVVRELVDGEYRDVEYKGEEAIAKYDELNPYAYYGNISQSNYVSLKLYHSLEGDEQEAYLEAHPELNINPRQQWLEEHLYENALLAVWGQAKITTMEAYNEFKKLIKELDIPDAAIPEQTLPPDGSVENYFAREQAVDEYGAQSAEAQLILLQDDELRNWYGYSMPEYPEQYYELKVNNREEREYWEKLSDRNSDKYVDDLDERREAFFNKYPDSTYFEDEARCTALAAGFNETEVELWAERYRLVEEYSPNSAEVKVWLIDHPDILQKAIDANLINPDTKDWNEPALRITVKWRKQDDEYDALSTEEERTMYLAENEDYRKARREREAWTATGNNGEVFSAIQIKQYVEYYELPEHGKRRERYLVENPAFADAMHIIKGIDIPEPEKVPSVQYDDIYDQYSEQFDKLNGLSDNKSEYYIEDPEEREKVREELRYNEDGTLTDFGLAEIRRNAYGMCIPDEYIDRYVEWRKIQKEGGYLAELQYLYDHPDFYETIYLKFLGLKKVNFDKLEEPEKPEETYIPGNKPPNKREAINELIERLERWND